MVFLCLIFDPNTVEGISACLNTLDNCIAGMHLSILEGCILAD